MDGPSNRNSGPVPVPTEVCAVEHKDCASRGAAGSHDGFPAGPWRPLAKLNPLQSLVPSLRSLGKFTCKGLIMEQLEILDLGDAMTETRCSAAVAPNFDNLYGAGHRSC